MATINMLSVNLQTNISNQVTTTIKVNQSRRNAHKAEIFYAHPTPIN